MSPGSTTYVDSPSEGRAREKARGRAKSASDALLYLVLALLVAATWQVSQLGYFTAGSDLGYWIGVVGGLMMLALFAYPLRKRWPVLARFGRTKYWFVFHMVLGIGGPLMVLAHSTFKIGSVNAGVALFSMLVVAASGVVGRFIYLRIHRGLGGEKLSLQALRADMGFDAQAPRTRLYFAPAAEQRLRDLEARATKAGDGWAVHGHRLFVLPWVAAGVRRACVRDADQALAALAVERAWPERELHKRRRQAGKLIRRYTQSVLKVAQFSSFVRLFSLWHVLHTPFVYVMVICAIVHVVAVHAY
jgi:hypothetical protein